MNNNNSNNKGALVAQKSGRQVRQNPPVNRLVGRAQRINLERLVLSQLARQPRPQSLLRPPRQNSPQNQLKDRTQLGAAVRTRLTKAGFSDIKSHRMTWVIGYSFVGDGTRGAANSVYFVPFSSGTPAWLVQGQAAGSSGLAPIAASDLDLGASYISDVEKHYARKVIKRMWIHVDSLHPATSNDMMIVVAASRGPGGGANSIPITYATAVVTANSVGNVSSMKGAMTVDAWESKTMEITDFIAGGSGPRQNEFEIARSITANDGTEAIYKTSGTATTANLVGIIPSCIGVAGVNSTGGLQNQNVHQITIEQEVDLLDYIGGMAQAQPQD